MNGSTVACTMQPAIAASMALPPSRSILRIVFVTMMLSVLQTACFSRTNDVVPGSRTELNLGSQSERTGGSFQRGDCAERTHGIFRRDRKWLPREQRICKDLGFTRVVICAGHRL